VTNGVGRIRRLGLRGPACAKGYRRRVELGSGSIEQLASGVRFYVGSHI
jgi:hypothetical protein